MELSKYNKLKMGKTTIGWTDRSENPLRRAGSLANYCTKVSPACEHCYAEIMSRRLAGISGTTFLPYKHMAEPPKMELHRDILASWAKRKKSYRNFVSSMTDVFLEIIPDEWIFEILDAMCAAPRQTFQVLTKRAERMLDVTNKYLLRRALTELPPNIWLMVTAENQKYYEARVPFLLQCRCHVRGVSCEPLLGPIDLTECALDSVFIHPLTREVDLPELMKKKIGKIDWVITGGESGNRKDIRPSHLYWFRKLQVQCEQYKVPFFFKQWGEWLPASISETVDTLIKKGIKRDKIHYWEDTDNISVRVGTKQSGNVLWGKQYLEFPL